MPSNPVSFKKYSKLPPELNVALTNMLDITASFKPVIKSAPASKGINFKVNIVLFF